jgi:hypothetical protein
MRKIIVLFSILVGTFALAVPAGAGPNSVPAGVDGTYTFSDHGTKVTVGFAPCGNTVVFPDGTTYTIKPAFYGKVDPPGGGGFVAYWTTSIDSLNSAIENGNGIALTDAARAQLTTDAATYTCAT